MADLGEEKEIGIQGLKKTTLREGYGYGTPDDGDSVEVIYSWINIGVRRDSVTKTMKFKLGKFHVEGWNICIKTMNKGERAIFTVPPHLAYGQPGLPPFITRNATVEFDIELVSFSTLRDISNDGGIFKKTLTQRENPKDLDQVFVKYEARLEDNTLVSKSQGVEFAVKDGYFCPALSKAVKTMNKGERVLLTVKPQYGFGETGRPAFGAEGAVPPNATLFVTLELVSWKTYVIEVTNDNKKILKEGNRPYDDLLAEEFRLARFTHEDLDIPTGDDSMLDADIGCLFDVFRRRQMIEIGNKGLMKRFLKGGRGYNIPEDGDEVEVHYTLLWALVDRTRFSSSQVLQNEETFKFKLGQGEVIKGLEMGIKTMRKGEVAGFSIPPDFAYEQSGSQTVPPNATLYFHVELLSWSRGKTICEDGGVFKKILFEEETPKDLDKVFVKYEARLENNTLISTSEGVEFVVEKGYFCPALSKAVKTMRKGEKVLLIVQPKYGSQEMLGPACPAEGTVPPNAPFFVTLELVSWKTVTNVTDDNKVIKNILREGEGYERPSDGAIAKVKLIGMLQSGEVFLKKGHDGDELFMFRTDDEEVIEGLDRAVMTMKKGEVSQLTIAPNYAFGSSRSEQELAVVPPDSTVYYEVELESFVKDKEPWDMDTSEKIKAALENFAEGSELFIAKKFAKAFKRFERVAKCLVDFNDMSELEENGVYSAKLQCRLMMLECCDMVLEVERWSVKALKALYRRAKVNIGKGELGLAKSDMKTMLEIDPDNRYAALNYKVLKQKVWRESGRNRSKHGNHQ